MHIMCSSFNPRPLFQNVQLDPLLISMHIQDEEVRRCAEESGRIRDEYQKYFDLEVTMNDFEEAYRTILAAVKKLSTESQWVPLNWVYS